MKTTVSRRSLLAILGVVGVIYVLRAAPWRRFWGPPIEYREIDGLPPFRRLDTGGETSVGSIAFVGVDRPEDEGGARRATAEAVRSDLCASLFGGEDGGQRVPIAYFSEFRCPYCRVIERDLDALLMERPDDLRLVQHELPIFGPSSELAARASLAAAKQGVQQPLRDRLMRSPFVADANSIAAFAEAVGLDGVQLAQDMESQAVEAELMRSRALADVFGFLGTPGLVVGHTVISGAIPRATLGRVVEDELRLPPITCGGQ